MSDLAKYQGAMDFCEFLRGKVPAGALLDAWSEYQAQNTLPVPNQAMNGFNARQAFRAGESVQFAEYDND